MIYDTINSPTAARNTETLNPSTHSKAGEIRTRPESRTCSSDAPYRNRSLAKLKHAAVVCLLWLALGVTPAQITQQDTDFWAYQLPEKTQLPDITNQHWPNNEIDFFILAKLESKRLQPGTDADKTTLIRRVYYDLTGLPPTPADIDRFLTNTKQDAFRRLVDHLLASPQFGERWGRHWLDIVRFAESVTLRGLVFGEAWRYRDYVVDALNRDLPYDEFIQEQIAGDLMSSFSLAQKQKRLIATTFLTLGNTNLEDQDKTQLRMDVVDEQLDTIGKAFMAQTLGCARCHDHKFDPIPAQDYYAMAGILRNTVTLIDANVSNWIELPLPLEPDQEKRLQARETAVTRLQSEIKTLKKTVASLSKSPPQTNSNAQTFASSIQNIQGPIVDHEKLKTARKSLATLESKLKELNASGPKRPMVMSVKEDESIRDTHVHIRGDVHSLGNLAPRGFLKVATHETPLHISKSESGRRQLGEWLANRSNPLTARVMVNRVWHWLLGSGIVRTADNFGSMGESPSHPDLLDYLAVSFMENGWSVKKLIREIVLSRTYQLSSDACSQNDKKRTSAKTSRSSAPKHSMILDPENRLFGRMNRRRLDAECIRDTILFVSGALDFDMGGNTIKTGTKADYGYVDTDSRRSLYVPVFRNALPELFDVFDFADPSRVTGRRNASTVAPQALFLLNHPFVMEQTRRTAERFLIEPALNDQARIIEVYRSLLGRYPTRNEQRQAEMFLNGSKGSSRGKRVEVWAQFIQVLVASIDFRYLN